MATRFITVDGTCLYGLSEPMDDQGRIEIQQFMVVEQQALQPLDPAGVRFGCCLDDRESKRQEDEFRIVWNGYLRLFNLCQFLPHAYFVTREGLRQKVYDGLRLFDETVRETSGAVARPGREAWDEVKDITPENMHGLLDMLSEHEWPLPEAGFELVDGSDTVVASAELAWEELRLAFLREDELAYREAFARAGWRIYELSAVLNDPAEYISLAHGSGG